MALDIGYFLLFYQLSILLYFLFINLVYTYITFFSFKYIRSSSYAKPNAERLEEIAEASNFRPISIVIPAYNEDVSVVDTVLACLKVRYPQYEIVVVDDGSTDKTLDTLKDRFNLIRTPYPYRPAIETTRVSDIYNSTDYPNLWVIEKEHAGKADSLNVGISFSHYPLFCSIDADSIIEPDALLRMGEQFLLNKELIAAGGAVRVLNGCHVVDSGIKEVRSPSKIIENIQIAEYLRGFMAGRVAWGEYNSLLIISGAFGVYRKDFLIQINGFRHTVGEDMDLVLRLHRYCVHHDIKYRVYFVPEPVCWTQVPSDLFSLIRQRNRWQRGLVDSIWHNREMMFNPRFGRIGLVGMPYFLFVELLGPIVEFIGYFSFVLFIFLNLLSPVFTVLFLLISILWGMWLNASAVLLDNFVFHKYERLYDSYKIAILASLEYLGFRQLIAVERLIGTFQVWRRHWGKMTRKPIQDKSDYALVNDKVDKK